MKQNRNMLQQKGAHRSNTAVRRLERFFALASLRCACCDEFVADPKEFGLRDAADWESRVDRALAWIRSHPNKVKAALPHLESEWPAGCQAVRELLSSPPSLRGGPGGH